MALTGHGVLVCLDSVRGVENGGSGMATSLSIHGFEERNEGGVVGVDGRHNGEVVLELVEVVGFGGRHGNSIVQRIGKRRVVRAERHFADDMGEVERWDRR